MHGLKVAMRMCLAHPVNKGKVGLEKELAQRMMPRPTFGQSLSTVTDEPAA